MDMSHGRSILEVNPKPDFVLPKSDQIARAELAMAKELKRATTFEQAENILAIAREFPELAYMSDAERKSFLAEKIRLYRLDVERSNKERVAAEKRLAEMDARHKVIDGLLAWCKADLIMEKPDGSAFREFRRRSSSGDILYLAKDLDAVYPASDYEKEIFKFAEILVVEHDWGAALKASELEGASINLPFDVCAFEFRFSGNPVIALATQFNDDIAFSPAVKHGDTWSIFEYVVPASGYGASESDPGFVRMMDRIGEQIRAICVALDAEIATSEIVREPHSRATGRNSYLAPKGYHVISLARRGARPLLASDGHSGRRKRLHFRRGHWRHFDSHKTWIKWMLVGDPDLGFVDKHYRL